MGCAAASAGWAGVVGCAAASAVGVGVVGCAAASAVGAGVVGCAAAGLVAAGRWGPVTAPALVAPVDLRRPPPPPPGRTLRRLGLAALAVALAAAVVWAGGWSPLGFERFDLVDADRRLTLRDAGEYVVYEEGDGASAPGLPSPLQVLVEGTGGLPAAEVTPALAPGEVGAPDAYRTPWHEGRALARFRVEEGGTYRLVVVPLRDADPAEYGPEQAVTLAVGDARSASWAGGPWGVALVVGVPAGVGVALLVASRRARRAAAAPAGGVRRIR